MEKTITYSLDVNKNEPLPMLPKLHDYSISYLSYINNIFRIYIEDLGEFGYDYSNLIDFKPKSIILEFTLEEELEGHDRFTIIKQGKFRINKEGNALFQKYKSVIYYGVNNFIEVFQKYNSKEDFKVMNVFVAKHEMRIEYWGEVHYSSMNIGTKEVKVIFAN